MHSLYLNKTITDIRLHTRCPTQRNRWLMDWLS